MKRFKRLWGTGVECSRCGYLMNIKDFIKYHTEKDCAENQWAKFKEEKPENEKVEDLYC